MEKIKELRSSLSIPSTMNSYSMVIEYMRNWFLMKFNRDFFKTVHIDGKHVLDDFRKLNKTEILKRPKPAVSIIPKMDMEWDRDGLDTYLYDKSQYIRKSKLESAFFKDIKRNMYLAINLEQIKMEFNFRIIVESRAQQIDLYKYMNMAFRIGATQDDFIDMDFHIPYSLMLQVAKDAGFEIVNEKITNPIDFVTYLNDHSIIPVLYKYRTINGKSEFFLRFREMYVHISCLDRLSADDGEREGMLSSNYSIDFNVTIKMPSPKRYMYYSMEEHELVKGIESDKTIGLFNIRIPNIPETNDKGWQTLLTTECFEDDRSKPLSIIFKELLDNSDTGKVIENHINMKINPSIFIDFKLFNNGKEIEYELCWETYTMTTKEILYDVVTNISIYVDLKYITNHIIQMNEMNESRMKKSK